MLHTPKAKDPIEEDLRRLERGIRELKIQYDRFFAGALPREPLQLKFDLKKIIKRYNEEPLRTYSQRFKFNSLVGRFNVMSELWTRNVLRSEEGDRRANAPREEVETGVVSRCSISDPRGQSDALRAIYREFMVQRHRNGLPAKGKVTFQKFVDGISAQASKLQRESGCSEIELRLTVKDRKVQLTARPRNRR